MSSREGLEEGTVVGAVFSGRKVGRRDVASAAMDYEPGLCEGGEIRGGELGFVVHDLDLQHYSVCLSKPIYIKMAS